MSIFRFNTRQEALNAGLVPARHSKIESIGTWDLYSVDISDANEYGYHFGIQLRKHDHLTGPDIPADVGGILAHSHDVWLRRDLNQIRQPGCFVRMYQKSDVDAAIERARAAFRRLTHND